MRILLLMFAPSVYSAARISFCIFGFPALPIMLFVLMKYVYFFELQIRASRNKASPLFAPFDSPFVT